MNRLTITTFTILLFGLLVSCNNGQQKEEVFSMNSPDRPISELVHLALEKGDTAAYYDLFIAYLDYNKGDFLPIALTMANKNDYPQAYYDVFDVILDYNGIRYPSDSLKDIDNKSKDLALEYLIMGAKKSDISSMETLTTYYLSDSGINRQALNSNRLRTLHGKYLDSLKNELKKDK
jgi:hypothetical protein